MCHFVELCMTPMSTVFQVVMECSSVEVLQCFRLMYCLQLQGLGNLFFPIAYYWFFVLLFNPKDGSDTFLHNVGFLLNCMVSQPR
jgi:hypothetical protein